MTEKKDIFAALKSLTGAALISDLKYGPAFQEIGRAVAGLRAGDYALAEWVDLISYLTDIPAKELDFSCQAEAKAGLLRCQRELGAALETVLLVGNLTWGDLLRLSAGRRLCWSLLLIKAGGVFDMGGLAAEEGAGYGEAPCGGPREEGGAVGGGYARLL